MGPWVQRERQTNRGSASLNLKLKRDAWHALPLRLPVADVVFSLVFADGSVASGLDKRAGGPACCGSGARALGKRA